jgi:dUTP pyrophosphatase
MQVKLTSLECMPVRAHATDAGADLIAVTDVTLIRGVRTLVGTGVHIAIPAGYVGLLIPRSSLSKKDIIMTNSVGVIDSDYRGEIMMSLMYIGALQDYHIVCSGTRIAQLVIVPILLTSFENVKELGDTERASGGFGSTG